MPCHLPQRQPKRKSSRKRAKSSESRIQSFFSILFGDSVKIAKEFWTRWLDWNAELNPTLYLSHHQRTPTKTIKLLEKRDSELLKELPSSDMKCLRTISHSKPACSSSSQNWTSTIKSERCKSTLLKQAALTSLKSSFGDSHSCGVCKLGRSSRKRMK